MVTGPDLTVGGKRLCVLGSRARSLSAGVEHSRVWPAGDVRAQSVKRVAFAVGEGALAVTLVHRYLAEQ